ncbi:MAG: hypothetical protein QNK04_04900 [Myxococcota bacterium]|nr:hypothetical protein [Myxococcota bacterium]
MSVRLPYVLLAQLLALAWGLSAGAAELTPDYVAGRWVVGASTCDDPKAETFRIDKDGTVILSADGSVTALGFWRLDPQVGLVDLHLIASPAYFDDRFTKEQADTFGLYQVLLFPLDLEPDGFRGLGRLGEQSEEARFKRCK